MAFVRVEEDGNWKSGEGERMGGRRRGVMEEKDRCCPIVADWR